MTIVQKLTPVKKSIIWTLQDRYDRQRKPGALKDELVAGGAFKNCTTADAYAAMAAGFLRDVTAAGGERPAIIEVGGGTGRFAFMFLNRLCNYQFADGELPQFDYFLTDPSATCVESWSLTNRFDPLIGKGILKFGQMAISEQPVIETAEGAIALEQFGTRPVILIANFQFSSVPSDLFRIKDHDLQRVWVRLDTDDPAFDIEAAKSFDSLTGKLTARGSAKRPTGHRTIDEILRGYAEREGDFYVSVPERACRFIEAFVERKAPCLMIAADQAYTDPDAFDLDSPFVFDEHFTQFTNFDLLAQQFRRRGGEVEFGSHPDPDFACGSFLYPGTDRPAHDFAHTVAATRQTLFDFDVADAHELVSLLKESVDDPSYRQMFAWLRMSKFDPDVATECLPHMFEELQQGHEDPDQDTIQELFSAAYRAYFPEEHPVTFDITLAQLFLAVKLDEDALALIETGLEDYGETPSRLYVHALCLLRVERKDDARRTLDKLFEIDPDYGPALRLVEDKFTDKKPAAVPKEQTLAEMSAHLRTTNLDPDVRIKAWDIFDREGAVLIDNVLQDKALADLRKSYHERVENWRIAQLGKPNSVGDKRFTVPIRVKPPFNNPNLFANPVIMDLLTQAMGAKPVLSAFGAVVTRKGARMQHIHREHPLLFTNDEVNVQLPCYAVNILFPLIDLDEEAGGTQVWERTHRTEEDHQWEGESTKVYTKAGSAFVLDYRVYHGGMACNATHNRPLLFLSYSLPWFVDTLAFDSHAAVAISEKELDAIPEQHRDMFKFARRIPD